MLIFYRRLLCKCKSIPERNSVINKLKDAGIEFQCKTKGTNSRIVATMQNIVWFNIYVNKYDYEKATESLLYIERD